VSIIYRKELAAIKEEKEKQAQQMKRLEEMQWGLDLLVREATQTFIDPRTTRPF